MCTAHLHHLASYNATAQEGLIPSGFRRHACSPCGLLAVSGGQGGVLAAPLEGGVNDVEPHFPLTIPVLVGGAGHLDAPMFLPPAVHDPRLLPVS